MERLADEQRAGNAVENYTRDLNKRASALAQNKQESDEFNSTIEGVLEPVGGAFLHPVAKNIFSNYVKPRLKKALGRGVRGAVRTARQVGTDLRDGVNPLENLQNNLNRGLDDIRGSVRDTVGDLENALSDGSQRALNNARALAGRSPLTPSSGPRDFSDTTQPQTINDDRFNVNTGQPEEQLNLYQGEEPREVSVFDTGDLSQAQSDAVDDIRSGRMSVDQALQRYRMRTMDTPTARQARANLDPEQPTDAEAQQSRFQARQQQLDQEAQNEARQQPDEPNSTDPNPAQDRQAPQSDGTGEEEAPPPSEDVPPPSEEDDLPEILGSTAEDIEVAGGGPEDIFTDILSGIVGLGSIIAGATIKKPVGDPNMNIANPSVQYGI